MTKHNTEEYYNQESGHYSRRRYEGRLRTYFQFLFRYRLSLSLAMVERVVGHKHGLRLLEIGCADGIVLRGIHDRFHGAFERMIGIDIASNMIDQAREQNAGRNIVYYVRGQESGDQVDLVMELGVHPYDLKGEIEAVANSLQSGGYFIYSLSSRDSIHAKIKLKGKEYLKDYQPYHVYETVLREHFTVIDKIPYGLFIPKLWAFPFIARYVQPFVEFILRPFTPNLFHEQIYLLKKKD